MADLVLSTSLTVVADYGQIYVYDPVRIDNGRAVIASEKAFGSGHPYTAMTLRDRSVIQRDVLNEMRQRGDTASIMSFRQASREVSEHWNGYLDALADATESRRFVGAAGGVVDLMTPGQYNFHTPLLLEVWLEESADDRDEWDHEVDIDLDVPSGRLVFEASGGSGSVTTELPARDYRARVSGRGFTALGHPGANGKDNYRLRLWPRREPRPAELRKSWPGWRDYR